MNECEHHLHPPGGGPPKKAFDTAAHARRALEVIRRRGTRGDKKPTRVYECPGCKRYFLTSAP